MYHNKYVFLSARLYKCFMNFSGFLFLGSAWHTHSRHPLPPESIEWFIDDQALLQSYDSAPRPSPSPLPPPTSYRQVGSLSQSSCV